ncbi:MAG: DsbA family protein [Candidatus Cloacimonetes bacterium]|nr:DsbA family protein [Candidatus Cloacimonadota bacterium]
MQNAKFLPDGEAGKAKNCQGKIDTPTAIVIAGLLIALGIYVSNRGFSLPEKKDEGRVAGQEEQGALTGDYVPDVSVNDDPVKGDPNAPVTIVEFSEYSCPYCKMYVEETYPQIIENYVDTGKVKYVFRDFPLDFHPHAQKQAEAAECADEQGEYWEFHDLLFQNSDQFLKNESAWVDDETAISLIKGYAKDLRLDDNAFNSCFDSRKYKDEVQKDIEDGINYGVSGTPSFFINGYLLVGAQPYEAFEEMIKEELGE